MKNLISRRKIPYLLLAGFLVLSGTIFLTISREAEGITLDEETAQQVRNALDEAACPTSNDRSAIEAAAGKLSSFIAARGGVRLSQSNMNALTSAELRSWQGNRKLSRTELADILTTVANDRLATLTDDNIKAMAESLRGFDAPDAPASWKGGRGEVMLRASGRGRMSIDYFVTHLKAMREAEITGRSLQPSQIIPPALIIQRAMISHNIASEMNTRLDFLKAADTDYFGASGNEITPTQALLIYYALTADDLLVGNQAAVDAKLARLQSRLTEALGSDFPSPVGHTSYGENGYIFSSPMNYLMDDATVSSFLQRIQAQLDQ